MIIELIVCQCGECCGRMLATRGFILLVSLVTALCEEEAFLTPCDITDTECLRKSTQKFLAKTANGVPEYDIRAIDPMHLTSVDYLLSEEYGVWNHLSNLTIIGLKNQDLSKFSLDTKTKAVELQTKLDLSITGDITVEVKKRGKSFSGSILIRGSALGTANYNYDFKTDANGVTHFEVSPERITCQPVDEVVIKLSPELLESLKSDPDIQPEREKIKSNSADKGKSLLCAIVEKAYVTVVHNIRASAKILPKDAFLKGV
ncbi:juvenile hormone-binding protein isoform X1 [Pieris rapae]|uniref:juvenile hormone-binding protein isoform X1 n=1 Tax=Pieris rapae TaxID=64459 RepID=UPI001E27DA5E|nr:juvenile hormone-binding protein isoform X1 [Pieris rapae]